MLVEYRIRRLRRPAASSGARRQRGDIMRSLVVALLLVGPCALPAFAGQVNYQIDFTGASVMNTPLPFGSFAYDPAGGFSNFFVNWNGVTFDLTSSANAPALAADPATGCDSAASDHQYGFIFMRQAATGCAAPAAYAWSGQYYGGSAAQFAFILNVTSGLSVAQDLIAGLVYSDVPLSPPMDLGSGGWTVSPEPSSLAMGLAAALCLAGMKLAGRSRRSR